MKSKIARPTLFALLLSSFSFVGCKVAGDKPNNEKTTAAYSYFLSTQYAIQSPTLAQQLSTFQGRAAVGTKESTFQAWATPTLGCRYAAHDTVSFKGLRALDIGDVQLTDAAGPQMLPQSADHFFGFGNILLVPGTARLETTSAKDAFKVSQSFEVPYPGSGISLRTGSVTYNLPTPAIVAQDDPDFVAAIDRSLPVTINYQAPEKTSYVKVTVSDGFVSSDLKIVCYGNANGPIQIPAEAFAHFKASSNGLLEVDFVNISLETNHQTLKESIIVSSKRHIHGRQDLNIDDRLEPIYFGALIIQ